MIVRNVTHDDIFVLSHYRESNDVVHCASYAQSTKNRIEYAKTGNTIFLVCEDEGKVVGQVLLKFEGTKHEPGYPSMEDLYVTVAFRGKGAGTLLIHTCERIAKEHGNTEIGLGVNPVKNIRAKRLYERLGYRPVGTPLYLDGVYDGIEDWVIDMKKSLTINM